MLKSLTLSAVTAVIALGTMGTAPVQARTLDLAFLPPQLEPQDVCTARREKPEDDLEVEGGEERLTDPWRIRYLERDIRRLQAEDAVKWFDFIDTLISRLAQLDPDFGSGEELLARIALHIEAGKMTLLRQKGLIAQLRAMDDVLTNNQRMVLAQHYLTGIGVKTDVEYAHQLMVNAAFGGNAEALLALARLELEDNGISAWDAPLDLTVTMAFGGLLGQLTPGVCVRAERIAREYLTGEVVSPNPQIAYQWYKFAADMGSARAAWRVVEFHLSANAVDKDNVVMLHYLRLAAQRGIAIGEGQVDALKSSGALEDSDLIEILGYNHSEDRGRNRPSVAPYLEMAVNIDGAMADEDDSHYMQYLRELSVLENAPGWVFTILGKEVLVRQGRWAGESEAMALLEEAARRDDPEGKQILAQRLVRYRDDPAQFNRAADLLIDTVTRHGMSSSMNLLDGLFRCQAVDAPRLREAGTWARNYLASQYDGVSVSATDLIALDPFKEPEVLGQIQSQAIDRRVQAMAQYLQRIQVDPLARDSAHRLWADRLDSSDQALEAFAELEFELATNPAERRLAIELFRRVYLNNGVTTALDLAIALVEDNARAPEIAEEIIDLLGRAANRGEGAAIRLKSRLLDGVRSPRAVYEEYAKIIDDRGDFLALMFALPYVDDTTAKDYFDRAVSLMTCGTKDVAELGEAHAFRGAASMSFHWRRISLIIEGGHVLSKLRLSDSQMAKFDTGAAPGAEEVYARHLAEGDADAHRRLFRLTSDPDLETYDPAKAAHHLLSLVSSRAAADQAWVLATFRTAPAEVREIASSRFDINALYQQAAQAGDLDAKLEFALLLRDTASTPGDLARSAGLLSEAAEAGKPRAMTEYGYALAYGVGTPRDLPQAIGWLDRAASVGETRAQSLANLLRLSVTQ